MCDVGERKYPTVAFCKLGLGVERSWHDVEGKRGARTGIKRIIPVIRSPVLQSGSLDVL